MIIKNISRKVVSLLDYLIPKNNKLLVFISENGDFSNIESFFTYIKKYKKYNKCVWLYHHDIEKKYLVKKYKLTKIYKIYSLLGFYNLFTSKFIFSSHSSGNSFRCNRHKIIHLWHGIGLKKIGMLQNNSVFKPKFKKNAYFTVCSNIDVMEFSSSFNLNPNNVKITGLSRNDLLFSKKLQINNLKKLLNYLNIKTKFNKVYFYLPTFRDNIKNNNDKNNNIFLFNNFDYDKLDSVLKKNKILLLVKLHPSENRHFKNFTNSNNIYNIDNNILQKLNLNIYDFMGSVDCLITDYSSVAFDYMLLDKPIISVIPDVNKYSLDRGLLLEPFTFWLPGKIVSTFDRFLSLLSKDNIYNKKDWEKHKLMKDIRHKYQDNKSCERVYEVIKNNLK